MRVRASGGGRSEGYSLVEMLVVVSIVGVITLVSVPAFMNFRSTARMKIAMRAFTTDLRAARQIAITNGRQVKVSFKPGPVPGPERRTYQLYSGDRAYGTVPDAAWVALTGPGSNPPRENPSLTDSVYFPAGGPSTPQTFRDLNIAPDGTLDVIFYPDGRAQIPSSATAGTITIRTDMHIRVPQYAIEINPAGRVIAR